MPLRLFSQQVADTSYNPVLINQEYNIGEGSKVFIDEGHNNFHTKNGRYRAFANLLERDGYDVQEYKGEFNANNISTGKILVISNALNKKNIEDWYLPTPSAFTKEEIKVVKDWVNSGGSLFLIADHMPMAGAAKELAAAFGFVFSNGFVFHKTTRGTAFFTLNDGSLNECIVTGGRDSVESVSHVVSFTGQGFTIPDDATSILTFDENYENLSPDTAWVFTENTPKINVKGWSQGAFKKFGKGRVVVFGEAAMFTAQLAGPNKVKAGMNDERAPQNFQLLLNIIHWLDGKL